MNPRDAFDKTISEFLADRWTIDNAVPLVEDHLRHLVDMAAKVNDDEGMKFSDSKLNRWLGWAQATLVICTDATLDEMKQINKEYAS